MPHAPALVDDLALATLPNGVRVLVLNLPHLRTACVSAYARIGSVHESRRLNGLAHVVEHMVFKGTRRRTARQLNQDAERLGAQVNAHTDRDHTAFHFSGLAADAPTFVQLLGELMCEPVFPPQEFERERQVLLHEYAEDEEDPMSTAFKLFDRACWGLHPAGQPVIGTRRNIERFSRDDLLAHVREGYTGPNLVVAAAGAVCARDVLAAAEAAFGALPSGPPRTVAAPVFIGGHRQRALPGCSQAHLVLGWGLPGRAADDPRGELAAVLMGEGMSSPLLHALREVQGLAYYTACAADVMDGWGQFVVEVSTSPTEVPQVLDTVRAQLAAQAERIDEADLERAHNQWQVQQMRLAERPHRLLEEAALDLLSLGRVRRPEERAQAGLALGARGLREFLAGLLAQPSALALAGAVPRALARRLQETATPPAPSAAPTDARG